VEFEGDSSYVYVGDKSSGYTRKHIQTGLSDGVNIEVLSGVGESDKIRGNKVISK